MPQMIFVNLPVKDLERSAGFYHALGWETDLRFSDENGTNVQVSDSILVMLLKEPFFSTFTDKRIADATSQAEVILALSAESREAVDELLSKALSAGGSEPKDPTDQGFMYSRTFQDPDGHIWETVYMDMSAVPDA